MGFAVSDMWKTITCSGGGQFHIWGAACKGRHVSGKTKTIVFTFLVMCYSLAKCRNPTSTVCFECKVS